MLAGGYAGWAGSLPPAVAEQRLRQALELADGTPDELVRALLPTLFSDSADPSVVAGFAAAMRAFHPAGLRAMAEAAAGIKRLVDNSPRPLDADGLEASLDAAWHGDPGRLAGDWVEVSA